MPKSTKIDDKTVDLLFLHGLRCQTIIGTERWEQQLLQTLIVDLDLGIAIANTDALADVVDYQAVVARVEDYLRQQRCHLLETLAERLATMLRAEFSLSWVRIRMYKNSALDNVQRLGVQIERGTK